MKELLTPTDLMEARLAQGNAIVEAETPAYIRDFHKTLIEKKVWKNPDFSVRGMFRALAEAARAQTMREATPAGALGQLLRVDTQRILDQAFKENQAKLSYLAVCGTVSSNKRQEFYTPLHTSRVLAKTPEGTPYGESEVLGEDIVLVNQKLMGGESFTNELFEDDQTGQVRDRQQAVGEGAIRTLEAYFAIRFLGTAGTFDRLSVPSSNWTSFPTSVNEFGNTLAGIFTARVGTAGLGNRVAALGQLSTPKLKEAQQLHEIMRDRIGSRLGQVPDMLLISPSDRLNAAIIANSANYPVTIGRGAETQATAVAGFAGQVFSSNPWQGLFNIAVNRYIADWFAAYGVAGRGVTFQMRDPIQVAQEMPMAGRSFDEDLTRLRVKTRFEFDWTNPRAWVLINDGSVSGTF